MYKKLLLGLLVLVVCLSLAQGVSAANNTAPVLDLPSTLTARVDVNPNYQVKATDADNDTLTFSATTSWATFSMNNKGLISFTPTESDLGSHSVTIKVTDGTANVSKTITFWVNEYCDDGKLEIDDVKVEDVTGDDDQLEPGDYLDIELDVRNKFSTSTSKEIRDIEVEAWVEDSDGDRITDKVEADQFDLDDSGDDENIELTLRIDPDTDSGEYTLVIEAKGEDEDDQIRCDKYTKDLDVERESHRLVIDNVVLMPTTAACGRTVEISMLVYNTGEKDEDDIKLRVRNSDMGLDKYSEIFDLADGKDISKMMLVEIPANVKAGTYYLEISAIFNDGKDKDYADMVPLTVTCEGTVIAEDLTTGDTVLSLPSTSATARIGETIKFTTTLMNSGSSMMTFTLSLSDVSDWASADIEPSSIALNPGANAPVYIYITPKSASTHTVLLSVYGDGQLLATKTLTIDVVSAAEDAEIEITEWGHGKSMTQAKALIKDYIGTAMLVILVAILAVIGLGLYVFHNRRRKPEIIYEGRKSRRRRRR